MVFSTRQKFILGLGLMTASVGFIACQTGLKNEPVINRSIAKGEIYEQMMLSPDELLVLGKQSLSEHYTLLQLEKNNKTDYSAKITSLTQNKTEMKRILEKLQVLQRTAIVDSTISDSAKEFRASGIDRDQNTAKKVSPQNPNRVRVTQWNIERGEEFETLAKISNLAVGPRQTCDKEKIRKMLRESIEEIENDSAARKDNIAKKKPKPNLKNWIIGLAKSVKNKRATSKENHVIRKLKESESLFIDEMCALNESDILVINEADYGLCRSGYRDVAREYAQLLKMNYAWSPEFVEVEPTKVGLEKDNDPYCGDKYQQDKNRNLIGNAILSRFPISKVRAIPFMIGSTAKVDKKTGDAAEKGEVCYDWHANEVAPDSGYDKGMHVLGEKFFEETVSREMRYGNRSTLIADITLPDGNIVTVVNFHLENKATSNCRMLQVRNVLEQLKDNPHPLVLAGDLNTTQVNSGDHKTLPSVVGITVGGTMRSSSFWLAVLPIAALPPGTSTAYETLKNFLHWVRTDQNPTRKNIYYWSENQEGHVFDELKKKGVVWKGPNDKEKEEFLVDPRFDGPWSSTNARDSHGFQATHWVHSPKPPTFGVMKLDWIFVKEGPNRNNCIIPRFPRTLETLRDVMRDDFPSDHAATTLMIESGPCGNISFLQ